MRLSNEFEFEIFFTSSSFQSYCDFWCWLVSCCMLINFVVILLDLVTESWLFDSTGNAIITTDNQIENNSLTDTILSLPINILQSLIMIITFIWLKMTSCDEHAN